MPSGSNRLPLGKLDLLFHTMLDASALQDLRFEDLRKQIDASAKSHDATHVATLITASKGFDEAKLELVRPCLYAN